MILPGNERMTYERGRLVNWFEILARRCYWATSIVDI